MLSRSVARLNVSLMRLSARYSFLSLNMMYSVIWLGVLSISKLESVSQRFFAASMVIAPLSASPMTSPDFNADTRVSASGMQRILKVFTLPFSP